MSKSRKDSTRYRMMSGVAHFILILGVVVVGLFLIGLNLYNNSRIRSKPVQEQIMSIPTEPTKKDTPTTNTGRKSYTCKDKEIYTNYTLNLTFRCLPNVDIGESNNSMAINIATYNFLWVTRSDIADEGHKDKIQNLISLKVGETLKQNYPDKEDSLTRIDNKQVAGVNAYVFEDLVPYEGNPYYIYIIDNDGSYWYIQTMSSGYRIDATPDDKEFSKNIDQILSTFKFTE